MTQDYLRAFLRAGMLIAVVSLVLVFSVRRESAEFVVSVCSLLIGLTLIGLVALMTRMAQR
jgi:hypothetical protein